MPKLESYVSFLSPAHVSTEVAKDFGAVYIGNDIGISKLKS